MHFPANPSTQSDLFPALINAQSKISFGQLQQGDDVGAKKEPNGIFGKTELKVSVVHGSHESNQMAGKEKCLAVAFEQVHGAKVYALLGTKATSNVGF